MMLHLSFREKPYLERGTILKSICDLATAILHSNDWNPEKSMHPTNISSSQKNHTLQRYPFRARQGRKELIVNIPIDPCWMHVIYIDVIISLLLNILEIDYVAWGQAAALLAINATAHPNHQNKPILWEGMEARDKLLAEAGLSETKVDLGWLFNFRQSQISLPEDKFISWTTKVKKLITKGTTTAKALELTIRRLNTLHWLCQEFTASSAVFNSLTACSYFLVGTYSIST